MSNGYEDMAWCHMQVHPFRNYIPVVRNRPAVKIAEGGLQFYFPFHFILFFLFLFFIYFLFLELGLGLIDEDHAVTSQVTSDDMVTSHMIQKKDVEGSERMMSYNVLNTYWPYGIHMAV